MFINAMGLIIADTKRISLGELSKPRALAAVPFGGRYRIVDFIISSMVNSGIKSVGLIAQNKYQSLMDHLGTGAPWDLDRKNQGLNILPPYVTTEFSDMTASDELMGILNYIRTHKHKYVIVTHANVIFNTTFNDVLAEHEKSGADVTLLYNKDGTKPGSPNYILETDRRGYLKEMLVDPESSTSNRSGLGIIIMETETMINLLTEAIAKEEKSFDLRLLIRQSMQLKIRTDEYKGIVFRVQDIKSYFTASMSLLNDKTRRELFWNGYSIFTKIKDEAPSLYSESSEVINSIISDGCRINGNVKDSVLFRGITIAPNSKIRNCVIFQDVTVLENCELENVIVDKNSVVRPGTKLVGNKDYPVVIGKGVIV